MDLLHTISEAFASLRGNKTRSLLTILGIVIGVGAVIALMSLGDAVQGEITGQISDVGSNLIFVFPEGASEELRNPLPLTMEDAEALSTNEFALSIQNVAPVLSGNYQVTFEGKSTIGSITGSTPEIQVMRDYQVTDGVFFSNLDVHTLASVAVIGSEIADDLFELRSEALGKTIRIAGQSFQVIGVLEEKGVGFQGNEDTAILIPISSVQARLASRPTHNQIDQIYVEASSPEMVQNAQDFITFILRDQHNLTQDAPDDFNIFTQQAILDLATQITSTMTIFLGAIAGISLVVGGIGIMNIMLVSVTERTREIGLRKALGARKRTIMTQFLTESVVLSVVGGVIGIILGYLLSTILAQVIDIRVTLSVGSVFLATLFSAFVGISFGIYPANRAANMPPVEALRYE
ncbi:MAG: ABC transporter permease [Anaerolineaceae bacterium]|nr:ABC transporter permease [Anaerolineaceae bacterium]